MISPTQYAAVYEACGDFHNPSNACKRAANAAQRSVGNIDVYNVSNTLVQHH